MKRLVRPVDRKIAGVCAGIARYFALDPTVVRVGVVALMIVTAFGPIVISYLLAALLIPEESDVP
ncbi:hypothetical protein A374_02069 [Fictibacillus macauensis ZFHKF-1]|uniref:Phage shock protein PspC N-terminal domain-containing protein n=1 Tax=Fictibacillus macauensis ZFHKF-1 TaxID=1196324 RepID=I8J5D8_9BACL|nr:PspC domain-containing protein [Fictibacillus macauensis]EIT87001.1 hypothetical protein A374_02069 [Fictibacillus macauensis ZFHKF-1]